MPGDIIARGMGSNAAIKSKQYTDTSIVGLANGFTYKGHKANIDALPTNAASGDLYTVEGKGPYAWNGSNWTSVALRGVDGKNGATGPRGPKGDPGPSTNSGVDIDDGYEITYFVRQEKPVTTLNNTEWSACRLLEQYQGSDQISITGVVHIYDKNNPNNGYYGHGSYELDPNKNMLFGDLNDGSMFLYAANNAQLDILNSLLGGTLIEQTNVLYVIDSSKTIGIPLGNIEDMYIYIEGSGVPDQDATLTNSTNLDFFNTYCILRDEMEVYNYVPNYYFFDIGTKLDNETFFLENGEPIKEIAPGTFGDKRIEVAKGGLFTYKIYDGANELITLSSFGPQYYITGKEVIFPDINEVKNTPEYKALGIELNFNEYYSYGEYNNIFPDTNGIYKATFDGSGPIIIKIIEHIPQ